MPTDWKREMPAELWQPWTPRPGQRVRVRRSAECPNTHHLTDPTLDDGLKGRVVQRPDFAIEWGERFWPRHPYLVEFDRPIPTGLAFPTHITTQRYAAIELEPEGSPDGHR